MDTKEIQAALSEIGWPIAIDGKAGPQTKMAVADFQAGYTFIELTVDGIAGRLTQAALTDCLEAQGGKCAEFFHFTEFASKGNRWIRVHPRLLNRLDALRRLTGPLRIISGYRDPEHNAAIGGAAESQHLYGTAADCDTGLELAELTELGFSGIGLSGRIGVHVDVRAEGPNNTTGADVGNPTMWHY